MSTRVVVQVIEEGPGPSRVMTTIDVAGATKVHTLLQAIDGLYRYGEPEIRAALYVANRVYGHAVEATS